MSDSIRFHAPFIVIEGDEYTGKSTLAVEVVRKLREKGVAVIHTREPGGTPFAEELRTQLLAKREQPLSHITQLLLHQASRKEHIDHVIRPALLAGTVVVCERFMLSTLALNVFPYMETEPELYKLFMDSMPAVVGNIPEPLTVILDLDEDKRKARGDARVAAKDHYESRSQVELDATTNAYQQLQNSPSAITLNADAKLDDLSNAVIAQIDAQFKQIALQHAEADAAFANSEVPAAEAKPVVEEPVAEAKPFVLETALEEWLDANINATLFNDNIDAVAEYRPLARTYILSLYNVAQDPALFEGANSSRMRREVHSRLHYGYQCDLLRIATNPVTIVEQA